MGISVLRRARWAVPALAFVAIAGVASACGPTAPPDGPACNDSVPGIIGGYPVAPPALGWFTSDTRQTGNVKLSADFGAPSGLGCQAVKLTTGENRFATGATSGQLQDKAQLFDYSQAGNPLSSITTISYWAYRVAPVSGQAPALALNVQVTGGSVPDNFATLVYEPYNQSGGQGAIQDATWQQWNATATTPGDGLWWSTKNGQSNLLTWTQVQALYPDATIGGYGFNIGSNNPNKVVAGDGLVFGDTSTNF